MPIKCMDLFLQKVRNQMEQMEDKDRHMETESTNRQMLFQSVEYLVVRLPILIINHITTTYLTERVKSRTIS